MIIKIWDCKTASWRKNSCYTTIQLIPSNCWCIARIFHIQPFRERLSEKVHATIPKGVACVAGGILMPGVLFWLVYSPFSWLRRHTNTAYSHSNAASYAGYQRCIGWFWVHCSSKKFERMAREAMDVCLLLLKENNKSRFDSFSVRDSVFIIPMLPFGTLPCTFFPTTFLKIAVW